MNAVPEGWGYDPVELGRRIVFAFSAGELQKFAQDLGVAGEVRWERGHAEAARDVVRQFEKSYGGLPTLVDRLRTTKPLVEWPEPAPPTNQAPTSMRGPAPIATIAHSFGAAPMLSSPGSLGGPASPTIPQAPAYVEASRPPPVPASFAPPMPAPAPAPAARPVAPPAPAWPGTVASNAAKSPSNGLDPRILIAVAGLMVVAAVIAYLAGRAGGSSEAKADASASPSASGSPARRSDGPSTRLATEIDRSVANVARACEIQGGSAEEVFTRAFDQCGPGTPQRPPRSHRDTPPPVPRDTGAPTDRKARAGGPNAQPREAPGASCAKNCAAETNACRSRCGPEPSEASRYGTYQQCMGRCIGQAARCKQSCP